MVKCGGRSCTAEVSSSLSLPSVVLYRGGCVVLMNLCPRRPGGGSSTHRRAELSRSSAAMKRRSVLATMRP